MYFVSTNHIVKAPSKNIEIWPFYGTIYMSKCQNRHSRPYLGVYVSAHNSVILSPIWTNKKGNVSTHRDESIGEKKTEFGRSYQKFYTV